jgi:hypothetical protein
VDGYYDLFHRVSLLFYLIHFPTKKKKIFIEKNLSDKQTFFRIVDEGGRFVDKGFGLLKPLSFSVVPIASRLLISA